MKWQHNETDLENFLSYLRAEMKENQQIVRIKIKNTRSTDTEIAIEPQGSYDIFPAGATYEVIALGEKGSPGIYIEIRDEDLVVICNGGAIFDKGAATLAY